MLEKYLAEAFQSLSSLTEDVIDINDDDMESKVSDIIDDEVDDSIDVIDANADTEDELEGSYIGKIIVECDVCHSKLYKDVEEIIPSEDDEDIVNIEEECPFCYSTDGYHIVGQVAPYQPEELSVDVEPIDNEDDVEEGLGDAIVSGAGGATIGSGVGMALGGLPGAAVGGLAGGIAGTVHGAKMESLPKQKFRHIKEVCDDTNSKNVFKKSAKVDESKSSSYKFLKKYSAGKNVSEAFNEPNKKSISESGCPQCDIVVDILQNRTYRKSGTYPRGFYWLSSDGTVGVVQYKGVKYAFRKRDDGTYKVMTYTAAGPNWSDTLYKEDIEDIMESGNKCTLKHLKLSEEGCYKEGFSKIELETDNDKIKVTSQPIENESEQEVLAPIAPANKAKIDSNLMDDDIESDTEVIEPQVDSDVDMTDIEEESLNSVCENFFKDKSPFVESFAASKVTESKNHLIVEGKLTFTNNCRVKNKDITFDLTPQIYYPNGKCVFNVKSNYITENCKLKLRGTIKNKKLVTESFG